MAHAKPAIHRDVKCTSLSSHMAWNTNWPPVSLCAEGRPHTVFGTGAGESQSCAGNKDQPDTPARQETHADGQTGEDVYCFIYIHISLYV